MPVINLLTVNSKICPALLCFVILELGAVNISPLPAGVNIRLSAEEDEGPPQGRTAEGASLSGSCVLFFLLLLHGCSSVCEAQWYLLPSEFL